MSKRLSDTEYVQQGGSACPFCKSLNIEGVAGVDVEGGVALQEIRCMDCDKVWHDVYRLIGYQPIGNPETCEAVGEESLAAPGLPYSVAVFDEEALRSVV